MSAACLLAPIDCHSYTDDEGALSDSVIEFSTKKRTGTRRRSTSAGAKSKHVIGSTRTRKGGRNSGISSDSGKSLSIRFCFSLVYTAHFFTCPPSFTYPLSHTHTHTHIFPPIPSITPDEKAAEPSSGSKSRGGRQGRGIGRPAGCPRATLASKKSPLRTVVGQSFYMHTPSYTYTHSHAYTHTHTHTHTLVSAACLLAPIDCHLYTDDEGALSDSVIEFSTKRTGTRRRSTSAGAKSKHVIGSTRTRKGGRNSGISGDSGKSLSICFSSLSLVLPPSFLHLPSHIYTHTHTHICPPIPSVTQDEETAEPWSTSRLSQGHPCK